MKLYCRIMWIVALGALISDAQSAALGSNELHSARVQASNSLSVFQSLITPSNYQLMGFNSTNEIALVNAGDPIQVYRIPLNLLRNFQSGQEFDTLLTPVPLVLVPILVGNEVRSSTMLRYDSAGQGQWTNINWGQSRLIKKVVGSYRKIPKGRLDPATMPFAVEIPALNLWFIGYRNRQAKTILHATGEIHVGALLIQQDQEVSDAGMLELSHMANRYNGLPN